MAPQPETENRGTGGLTVDEVRVSFGGIKALDGVSLEVSPGIKDGLC